MGPGTAPLSSLISDVAQTDLNTFFSYFPIHRTGSILRRSVDGAVIGGINNDADETALDVETIASLAPGAKVVIYLIPELSDQAIDDAINRIVSDNDTEVVNMSFGGDEFQDTTFEAVVRQGNAQGITFVASSGDSGSNRGVVSTPAAELRVLAVGGTVFAAQSDGRYGSETAWSGSGGGVSSIFGIPSYQQGVSGLASNTQRNVPDISFPARYTDTFVNGRWVGLEGTSWSSPIYVSLQLEINQMRNQRFGLVNSNIYRVQQTDFHDIAQGNNGEYLAKTGYDNVTGRGSPRGVPLGGGL
jgi:kumamolisin